MIKTANFPASVWDGLTNFRTDRRNVKGPDHEDWDEMLAELLAVETFLYPMASDLCIWVAPHGKSTGTGSITNPFGTIALALAAVTATKKTVCMLPGTYTPAAILTIPTQTGFRLIGIGGSEVTTITGAELDQVMTVAPGAQSAAYTSGIKGVTINQFAAKKGIFIDCANIDDIVTIDLKDVTINMDSSGASIDQENVEDVAVALNLTDCDIDGAIQVDIVAATDLHTFVRSTLVSVVSDAGTGTGGFLFKHCKLFAGCLSGGHSNQTVTSLYCESFDGALASTTEFTGSHTETLIAP